jgi:hypothetical protein
MALTVGDYLRPARSMVSSSVPTMESAESSGQTFSVGELLQMTSSGNMAVCATTSAVLKTGNASGTVYGVALTTGKALADAQLVWKSTGHTQYVPAVGWMIWEAAVVHGTTASSIVKANQMGQAYSLKRSASNKVWYVAVDTQSPIQCYVVGFRDATGTQNGHVYFVLTNTSQALQWRN